MPTLDKIRRQIVSRWLNLQTIMLLIKVLSLLPNYLCFAMLIGVPSKINKLLISFLWEGEKRDTLKKIALVKWDKVLKQKPTWDVGTKDPSLMNKTLGVKTPWNIVTIDDAWWKFILQKKYFLGVTIDDAWWKFVLHNFFF
jgi:hypothetical protein